MRGKSRCRSLNGPENAYWSTAGYLENFHDLNLIEQLWDQLRRAVHARLTNMTTLADLHQMLVEEWDAFPQQCVTKLNEGYFTYYAIRWLLHLRFLVFSMGII
uniref:Tc1-like transposase DDE domain-containing protein n=1 Tax=Maylandia zebra TaxID=106582 RepID=A0A3P9BHC0_9CICH